MRTVARVAPGAGTAAARPDPVPLAAGAGRCWRRHARDGAIRQDAAEMLRQASVQDVRNIHLNAAEIADVVAFLNALTGVTALERPLGRPDTVPSGLPVD